MRFHFNSSLYCAMPVALLFLLTACGGGGGNGGGTSGNYSVGGIVAGLNGSVVLQNNNGDNITVASSNTNFTFATKITNGNPYRVTVLTQPSGQTCVVNTGSGTIASNNINNVAVNCLNQMGGVLQGVPLSLASAVNNFSGSGTTGSVDNAVALLAAFSRPFSITTDGINLYIADSSNNKIRKIVIASGAVTTLAGSGAAGAADNTIGTSATFQNPEGITTDGTNLYVADSLNNKIRKVVIASSAVTTLAGSGAAGAADNTIGTSASFQSPEGITTDGTNLYVSDSVNNEIRKIVIASGAVTTLAGSITPGSADNIVGTSATFQNPIGITTDGVNLYVTDSFNNEIRKVVIASGAVTTLAGAVTPGAVDNNIGTAATFNYPIGITTDGTNLYVADFLNNKIRKIVIASGAVTTLAGSGTPGSADATKGTAATFNQPAGITTDGTGLYVADSLNNKIRKVR